MRRARLGSAETGAVTLVLAALILGMAYSVVAWVMAWPRLRWMAIIDAILTPVPGGRP